MTPHENKPILEIPIVSVKYSQPITEFPNHKQITQARIQWVQVVGEGILIKQIGLYNDNGEYIRDAKLNGDLLCTLTEHLLPITICK
jgi:hypothetical protein